MAPEKDSCASWAPVITSGSMPRICRTPARNSSALEASLVALVATMRTAWEPESPIAAAYSASIAERPRQGLGRQLAGGIDALAEPHDLRPAVQVDELTATRVQVGDEQPD